MRELKSYMNIHTIIHLSSPVTRLLIAIQLIGIPCMSAFRKLYFLVWRSGTFSLLTTTCMYNNPMVPAWKMKFTGSSRRSTIYIMLMSFPLFYFQNDDISFPVFPRFGVRCSTENCCQLLPTLCT